MRIHSRPAPLLLLGVVVVAGAIAAAALAHFELWQIAALLLVAVGLLALSERSRLRARAQPSYLLSSLQTQEDGRRIGVPPVVAEPIVEPEAQPEQAAGGGEPNGAPLHDPIALRQAERRTDRRVGASVTPTGHRAQPSAEQQWNLWELDRLAQQRATDNDEIAFLLFYLRDFADPEGLLPTDFEPLVRETFGNLLATPVA